LKVPIYHENKESITYVVKVKKYDTGAPEEFLRRLFVFNEQLNNRGYSGTYYMALNLTQAMVACTITGR
jgi:hypothetical protein